MNERRARDFEHLPNLIAEVEVAGEEDDYYLDDDLDLNKTLPRNFRIHPPPMEGQEQSNGIPKRSISTQHISSSTADATIGSLSRIHPVATSPSSSLTNLATIGAELRKSDPSLHRICDRKKANSFHMHSKSMDERSRLPVRAQSLYTKSQSPPFCSPRYSMITPSPCGSPHSMSPGMSSMFFSRRDIDRGRRYSATSSGYSTTGCTDSPSSLSSYGSHETIPQAFEEDASLSQQSSISLWSLMDDESTRPLKRSRSLSPVRTSRASQYELESLNSLFRERFPKAKEQMEEKLQEFLDLHKEQGMHMSDGYLSYLRNQIIQHARDLLTKSIHGLLSSQLFMELAESLDIALHKVYEHAVSDDASLKRLIKQLLAIISRPARLLEVLDFNAEAYYQSLDETEHGHAKELLSSHVPFLLSRLKASLDSQIDIEESQEHTTVAATDLSAGSTESPPSRCSVSSSNSTPQLNNFERIKLISQGAYSSVYLVRHKQTKMRFAMKRLSKQRMIMKKQVQNIFQERDVLTVAENPFVVGLWCSFQTERSLYLVMEYVEGGDLASLIKHIGSLPLDLARMYFAETVLALEYIHNLGIIHRDLKPDNLLITSDGHIKVTDFGLSKMGLASLSAAIYEDHLNLSRDQQFTDEQILGTPDYIAPEVILGRAYGFPVDWWSMGVILYQMLVGITPFASTTVEALFEEITNDNLVIEWPTEEDEEQPPPPVAQNLVESLLQHEPQNRLGSASRGGVMGVKEHEFFRSVDWHMLLRQKAQFVPELHGEDDTSYFDTRSDRYHHDEIASDDEDYDDEQYHFPFTNFGTITHRYSMMEKEMTTCEKKHSTASSNSEQKEELEDSLALKLGELKVASEEGEDPIALHEHEPALLEGDPLRDGTVTPETPIKDTPPVVIVPPATADTSNVALRGRRRGTHDITAASPRLSPEHPITVTPPTPAADATLSETYNFPSIEPMSPVADNNETVSPLSLPSRMSSTEVPYYVHKGETGYGIVLQSVRVYIDKTSDKYRLHHILQHVDERSSAWDAGLRPGFVITHVNGEPVTGLLHVQVVQLMLNRRHNEVLAINAVPFENTSIQTGHRKSNTSISHKMVKKLKKLKQKTGALKKRSRTIFRNPKDHSSHSRPQSPPSGSPSHSVQHRKSEGAMRSDSFMKRLSRIGSPKKPISPLAHSPSPTSVMTTRSRSTSPLTVAHGSNSPNSSPTGSTQYLHEMESYSSSRKAPERSSSLHSALPKKINSPTRPERRSWFGEFSHSRKPSCEGISSLVTAANKSSPVHQKISPHGSPLVQRTFIPEGGGKGKSALSGIKPMRSHSEHLTWRERKAWFEKQ